jgi:hypothetical protein
MAARRIGRSRRANDGPACTAPHAAATVLKSEHANWLNWTPNSGPAGVFATPGLTCSWMIWLAVRVVKALPLEDRYAAVSAFAIAASVVGSALSSSPVVTPRPEVIVALAGAPDICPTVRTLPTRSTTGIVAGLPRALASLIA